MLGLIDGLALAEGLTLGETEGEADGLMEGEILGLMLGDGPSSYSMINSCASGVAVPSPENSSRRKKYRFDGTLPSATCQAPGGASDEFEPYFQVSVWPFRTSFSATESQVA